MLLHLLKSFIVLFTNCFSFSFYCYFQTPNSQIEHLGSYIGELSLLDYDCLRFLPSIVAASVIFLAKFIICPEVHPWVSIFFYAYFDL